MKNPLRRNLVARTDGEVHEEDPPTELGLTGGRREGFAAIEHAHEEDPLTEDGLRREGFAALRRRISGSPGCGWWWCGQSVDEGQRKDLLRAIRILQNDEINPNGMDVLTVATAAQDAERLGRQRELVNAFLGAARKLRAGLWPNGKTETIRNYDIAPTRKGDDFALVEAPDHWTLLGSVIERFEPLGKVANAVSPIGQHGGTKNADRAALGRGLGLLGWGINDIAAALVLTGVERKQSLKQVYDRLRKTNSRRQRKK